VPSQGLVNCLAGYGDYMSFGLYEWLRDKTNAGGVDKCSDAYRYCTYIGMAQDLVILPRAIVDLFQALPKGCNTYTYVGVKTTYTPRLVKPKFPETAQSRINVAKVPKNNGEVRGFNYCNRQA
jgi:hypothetical protein